MQAGDYNFSISSFTFVVVFVGIIKIVAQLNEIIGLLRSKSKIETELIEAIKTIKEKNHF
ncbi:hypothetical protein SNF32_01565 [Enterococcus mundtii]|nr:hypothetical protein [Enterococcus mundtii]